MKTKIIIGRVVSILVWPLVVVYIRFGSRTRILIEASGKVLLVKGWLGNGKWSLPGGGLKRGETPLQGVIRETEEETGLLLEPKDIQYLGQIRQIDNFAKFKCERFIAQLKSTTKPKLSGIEIIEAAWVDPKTLDESNANKDVLDLLTV